MEERFVPRWIAWEVTGRCNLSCVHCRARAGAGAGRGELSPEEGRALIDDIASFCKPVLVLSGGEPLLRPDVFELARHGSDRGLRMALATNGTLVDAAACARMKDAGIGIVSISLDGASAAVHDGFRRQAGSFSAALDAARALRRAAIPFIVNSSFTKRNQADIPGTFRLAKSLGARAWYLFMVVPVGRGERLLGELIGREDYERVLEWHFEAERGEPELLMRPICAPHYYRIAAQRAKALGLDWRRRSLSFSPGGGKGCLCGQSIAFVGSRGEVRPCSYFPADAGSVRDRPLSRIWNESKLFASLRDFKSYKGKCGACEYLNVCGGCRARAGIMSGDCLGEEPLCSHAPRRAP
ncbi:MAG: radical SAM protein [Elusimicrobia bacterium]|nr:radical SAM protein [Elusimicrobiota bacterium]